MDSKLGYYGHSSPHSFCLSLLLFVLISGCITGNTSNTLEKNCPELVGSDENAGRISVFLHTDYPGATSRVLRFKAVDLLIGDEWIPLMAESREIIAGELVRGQVFLGSRLMPTGEYKRFRVVTAGRSVDKITDIDLGEPMVIGQGSSNALFLRWDASDQKVSFKFDGTSQTNDVATNILVVTCPDINTLYFIRTDKNRIYGSLAIPGLSYFVVDDRHKRLFVLVPAEAKIKILDMIGRRVSDEIDISGVINPNYILMDPDARNLYILDERGNMVRIDIKTGNVMAQNRIGHQLVYAIFLAEQGKLAVSSTVDRKVYLVDPVDLRILEAIETEGEPHGLLALKERLYISESSLNNVMIYDLDTRRVLKNVPVAAKPRRLVRYEDNVYVSNRLDGSVFLIKDGSYHVVKEIGLQMQVDEMAIDEGRRFLYVANVDCQGVLSVIDTSSNQISGKIELGAKPLDLEVVN